MCEPSRDPRDDVHVASEALWGIVLLLDHADEVDRAGVAALLHVIHDRLDPAMRRLVFTAPE